LSEHKFKVGQSVHYSTGPYERSASSSIYRIMQLLPTDGDDRRYRIKSANEPHERVAKEIELKRAL
jgi:hypothetical protein